MVIQHNLSALCANMQLGVKREKLSKSMEKLSSGYKINRSADDAAGLSISEKMRKQIRGLSRAAKNIQDGISLCQVADGALNETEDILQRIRVLAVESANGTNSTNDRQNIDMEVEQLKTEIDRIANTTSFNDFIYPLKDDHVYDMDLKPDDSVPDISDGTGTGSTEAFLKEMTVTFKTDISFNYEGIAYRSGDSVTITGMTTNGKEIRFDGGNVGIYYGAEGYSFTSQSYTNNCFGVRKSDLLEDEKGYIYFNAKADGKKWYYAYKKDGSPDPIASGLKETMADYVNNRGYSYFTASDLVTTTIRKFLRLNQMIQL